MKKVVLKDKVRIVGVRNDKRPHNWMIDYYLVTPNQERLYAFSRKFTNGAYDLCKSPVFVNDISSLRSMDRGVMKLVNYLNYMLPYLVDYYDLKIA